MSSRIREILQHFQKCKFMVIGDLILDYYAFGSVKRISPEAPIQILDIEKDEYRLGGAANVANNMLALQACIGLGGVIGEDQEGNKMLELLQKAGMKTKGVVCEKNRITTVKTRFISQGNHLLRTDREVKTPILKETSSQILEWAGDSIEEYDAVVLSDYAKGVLTEELCVSLIKLANQHNKKVFVGPKGKSWKRYETATLISANRTETEAVLGVPLPSLSEIEKAAFQLQKELAAEVIVITLGSQGMYVQAEGQGFHMAAEAKEVFDVAGAGDTVLALFALVGTANYPWKTAASFATAAAGIVVGKVGTAVVSSEELEAKLGQKATSYIQKIQTLEKLLPLLENHRTNGKVIVFTNGCFDILHPGHIRYLEYCKSRGDILVVGLNSDSSVHSIKGPNRPIIPEKDRAEVLAALSSVDYVVIFSEATPLPLITQIKPDVLIKGSDWEKKGVVGRELVEQYGGKVELYEIQKGYSTSHIIEKIVNFSKDSFPK